MDAGWAYHSFRVVEWAQWSELLVYQCKRIGPHTLKVPGSILSGDTKNESVHLHSHGWTVWDMNSKFYGATNVTIAWEGQGHQIKRRNLWVFYSRCPVSIHYALNDILWMGTNNYNFKSTSWQRWNERGTWVLNALIFVRDFCTILFLIFDCTVKEYARIVFHSQTNKNLFTMNSIKAMCNIEKTMEMHSGYQDTCIVKTHSRSCCRPWSLSRYITLISNRPSCENVTSVDVDKVSTGTGTSKPISIFHESQAVNSDDDTWETIVWLGEAPWDKFTSLLSKHRHPDWGGHRLFC